MEFPKERWVRLYRSESPDHSALPVLCRGLRDYLLRRARTENGLLVEHATSRGNAIETLVTSLGTHDSERETVTRYLYAWVEDGFLSFKSRRGKVSLGVTRYVEGQDLARQGSAGNASGNASGNAGNAKSTPRTRKHRAKKRREEAEKLLQEQQDAAATMPMGGNTPGTPYRREEKREELEEKDQAFRLLAERARHFVKDPTRAHLVYGGPHTWVEVREVVATWNEIWDQRFQPNNSGDARVRAVVERLAEDYTVSDLCDAIRGAVRDPWLRDKPKLHSLKHVLRDADAVDGYRRLMLAPTRIAPVKAARVQPTESSGYYDKLGYGEQPSLLEEGDDEAELAPPKVLYAGGIDG